MIKVREIGGKLFKILFQSQINPGNKEANSESQINFHQVEKQTKSPRKMMKEKVGQGLFNNINGFDFRVFWLENHERSVVPHLNSLTPALH